MLEPNAVSCPRTRHIPLAITVTVLGLGLSLAAASTAVAMTKQEAGCRARLAKGIGKYARAARNAIAVCHSRRDQGLFVGDCNVISEADLASGSKLDSALAKTVAKLDKAGKCLDTDGQPLANVLSQFPRCTAPFQTVDDAGATDGIDDVVELVECLAAHIRAAAEASGLRVFGLPSVPLPAAELTCRQQVSKSYEKLVKTHLKVRNKCQIAADKAGGAFGFVCVDSDPKGLIAKAELKASADITAACPQPSSLVGGDASGRSARLGRAGGDPTACTASSDPASCVVGDAAGQAGTGIASLAWELPGICPEGRAYDIVPIVSNTEIDAGFTGIAHDLDPVIGYRGAFFEIGCDADCANCGTGPSSKISPAPDACRCKGDASIVCSTAGTDPTCDGVGGPCECFYGPVAAINAGSSPVCVETVINDTMTGSLNPQTGDIELNLPARVRIYLGILQTQPCPLCENDVCVGGARDGLACSPSASDATYGDVSYDCPPSASQNVTGAGMFSDIQMTTGEVSLTSSVPCTFAFSGICACGLCSGDTTVACSSDAECAAAGLGTCGNAGGGFVVPNNCTDGVCSPSGSDPDEGVCNGGPVDSFCDGFVTSTGQGILQCLTNADCDAIGFICPNSDCGACSITRDRECFLDPIHAAGVPAESMVSLGCFPKAANPGVNSVVGWPGPVRIKQNIAVSPEIYCSDGVTPYIPPGGSNCPVCGNGLLEPGEQCDDGNDVGSDCCSSTCQYEANGAPCGDGQFCNGQETCDGGGLCIAGAAPDCDDANPCTDDACSESLGCTSTNNSAPCDDGDACTTTGVCLGGACVASLPLDCDDGNVCTDDTCVPGFGCSNAPNSAACDDGNPCTTGDACVSTACGPGAQVCDAVVEVVLPASDPAPGDTIEAEIVIHAASAIGAYSLQLSCDDTVADIVTPVQGGSTLEFSVPPLATLTGPCAITLMADQNSSNAGPTGDVSVARVSFHVLPGAVFGASTLLDLQTVLLADTDGVPVTFADVDAVLHVGGERFQDNGDGTITDRQTGLMWEKKDDSGGVHDQDNQYTWSALVGGVTGTNFDGTAKTDFLDVLNDVAGGGSSCFAGHCDWRLPSVNRSGGTEELDGLVDASEPAPKIFTEFKTPCTPGCNVESASCSCTRSSFYWSSVTATGADEVVHYVDFSSGDVFVQASSVLQFVRAVRNVPSFGVCGDGLLDPGEQCDDGNALDGDCCSSTCQFEVNGAPCGDGQICNGQETCDGGGLCIAGTALDCDDANPCTDDACSQSLGCTSTNNTAPCDDGDVCTTTDVCSAGSCVGTPLDCDDGNVCTDDACVPGSGCTNTNNTAACDDEDPCTAGDVCTSGACTYATRTCDASVELHVPAGDLAPDDTVEAEIVIRTAVPLGGYNLQLSCDDTIAEISGPVQGGNTAEYSGPPGQLVTGPCSINLAAFQTLRLDGPTGEVSVARVTFHVLPGASLGSSTILDVQTSSLSDTSGSPSLTFTDVDAVLSVADARARIVPNWSAPDPGSYVQVDVRIDTGTVALGSYVTTLTCDPSVLEVSLPALGGTTLEFSGLPTQNLVAPCELQLLGFQNASSTSPVGDSSVARVNLHVLSAAPLGATPIELSTSSVTDTNGVELTHADTPTSVVITPTTTTTIPTPTTTTTIPTPATTTTIPTPATTTTIPTPATTTTIPTPATTTTIPTPATTTTIPTPATTTLPVPATTTTTVF